MSVMSGTRAGFSAIKSHWIFFLISAVVLVGLVVAYDAKPGPESGKIRIKIAETLGKLPIVGTWFGGVKA